MLFSGDIGGRSKENLRKLYTKPLNKYRKVLNVFRKNLKTDYHQYFNYKNK